MNRVLERLISVALAAEISFVAFGAVPVVARDEISITVNGEPIQFEEQPFIMNDCTMVPYNGFADALGIEIKWDKVNQKAILSKGTLYRYEGYAELSSGERIELEAPPTVVDGRAFVPLRAVCDLFYYSVQWDSENQSIQINTKSEIVDTEIDDIDLDALLYAENSQSASFLDGRINMMLPENIPIEDFVLTASRILVYKDVRIIISPRELYRKSAGDLLQDAKNLGYEPENNDIIRNGSAELLSLKEKTEGLKSYLVKTSDNGLISLTFSVYYEKIGASAWESIAEWIERTAATVCSGDRSLDTGGGVYELEGLKINVPKGYTAFKEYRVDFTLIRIVRPVESDKDRPIATIYVGFHPELYEMSEKQVDGTFLGMPVVWSLDSEKNAHADLVYKNILKFNLTIFATNKKERDELIDIFENIEGDAEVIAAPYLSSYEHSRKQTLEEIREEK